jgi:hypothetical protein
MRTYPFASPVNGELVRIVEPDDGECVLETSGGARISHARITGPEILKLSEQGAQLWKALDGMLSAAAGLLLASPVAVPKRRADLQDIAKGALAVLDQTAPTFDHNEPEEGLGDVLDAFKAGIDAGPVGSPEYRKAANRHGHDSERPIPLVPDRASGRCLIHFQDEPCPTCAGYKAAGL